MFRFVWPVAGSKSFSATASLPGGCGPEIFPYLRFMIWMWFVLLYLNIMWIGIQFVCRYAYLCVEDR